MIENVTVGKIEQLTHEWVQPETLPIPSSAEVASTVIASLSLQLEQKERELTAALAEKENYRARKEFWQEAAERREEYLKAAEKLSEHRRASWAESSRIMEDALERLSVANGKVKLLETELFRMQELSKTLTSRVASLEAERKGMVSWAKVRRIISALLERTRKPSIWGGTVVDYDIMGQNLYVIVGKCVERASRPKGEGQ